MAAAGPQSTGTEQAVQLVGTRSGRCVEAAATGNGSAAQLGNCVSGSNQRWTYTTGRQRCLDGNKCLDASGQGTANGTAVIVRDCGGQVNQQWNLNANGTVTGVQAGLCPDAVGNATAAGTRIDLWACHGGANQQWSPRGVGGARRVRRCRPGTGPAFN
ncbi:hypothetical protein Aab01nite_80300 [Paractinoplanes abujensis]|uniref:Ricin B lectin domain-containing protein n=1 Tax=Paractinoplanes abujensis TaxID=882441 RepID=A0A7W7CR81_9ACTN|nr:RICIN domain-containing protein [Actinoplanes abujensis]MBB4693241.1 hypothetical protein [Actinoplanes abujensis]GID24440.1 hypothetical protein Aab01nite_80300 [Actinoplanes abujensis]